MLDDRARPIYSPPKLSTEIQDFADPIRVGQETTYLVRVLNKGESSDSDVVLVITVPLIMTPVDAEIQGPTSFNIIDQTIRFEPVAQLAPGGDLVYRIRVRANSPGKAVLRAQLTSQSVPTPLSNSEDTDVVAAGG